MLESRVKADKDSVAEGKQTSYHQETEALAYSWGPTNDTVYQYYEALKQLRNHYDAELSIYRAMLAAITAIIDETLKAVGETANKIGEPAEGVSGRVDEKIRMIIAEMRADKASVRNHVQTPRHPRVAETAFNWGTSNDPGHQYFEALKQIREHYRNELNAYKEARKALKNTSKNALTRADELFAGLDERIHVKAKELSLPQPSPVTSEPALPPATSESKADQDVSTSEPSPADAVKEAEAIVKENPIQKQEELASKAADKSEASLPMSTAPPLVAQRQGNIIEVVVNAELPEVVRNNPAIAEEVLREWIRSGRLQIQLRDAKGNITVTPEDVIRIRFASIHFNIDASKLPAGQTAVQMLYTDKNGKLHVSSLLELGAGVPSRTITADPMQEIEKRLTEMFESSLEEVQSAPDMIYSLPEGYQQEKPQSPYLITGVTISGNDQFNFGNHTLEDLPLNELERSRLQTMVRHKIGRAHV